MNTRLPDVALTECSTTLAPLEWVGMQGIDLPISLGEPGVLHPVHARADVQVDLPDDQIKGIHMSRLYRLIDSFAEKHTVTPTALATLLKDLVLSHADCHSTAARLALSFQLLCKRPALVSEGLSGWKSYPVRLEATWRADHLQLDAIIAITYSSTCPCSAALSRQLVEEAFMSQFGGNTNIDPSSVAAWLRTNATLATPHSQRSVANVRVSIAKEATKFGLFQLIDLVESALGTPVQTAVKRADEQAFARLNGQNLMYVEDAARKVQQVLARFFLASSVTVCHLESLHPHDAVASAASPPEPSPAFL